MTVCGRFAMDNTVNDLIAEFVDVTGKDPSEYRHDWDASWNISPTENIPVLFESVKGDEDVQRRFQPAHWSLVPFWAASLKLKYQHSTRGLKASLRSPHGVTR